MNMQDVMTRVRGIVTRVGSVFLIILAFAIVPAIALGIYGVAKTAFDSIYRLGMIHFAPLVSEKFRPIFEGSVPVIAASTVGVPLVFAVVLVIGNKVVSNTGKAMMVLFMVLGIIEITLLYFYEQALTLGVGIIPTELANLGAFIYAGIGGFNLLPAVLVPVVAFTAPQDKHATLNDAVGAIFHVILHAVVFIAGVAAEFYFGIMIGLPAIYVTMAALLIGLGYLWSGLRLGGAHKRGDRYDVKQWSTVQMVFSAYLGIVGALAVAELATGNHDVVPALVKDVGIRLNFFVQFILLAVLAYVERKTKEIDDLNGDGKDDKTGQVIGIRLPGRAGAVWQALKGESQPPAQLPAPATMTMAQEKPKVSERTGQRYDATGTIVMDEETEKARQRAKAERDRLLRSEPASIYPKSESGITGGDNPKS